jgi:hypothetical protein
LLGWGEHDRDVDGLEGAAHGEGAGEDLEGGVGEEGVEGDRQLGAQAGDLAADALFVGLEEGERAAAGAVVQAGGEFVELAGEGADRLRAARGRGRRCRPARR